MTARDDVIEQANYFRDAAKDCVVELEPGVYVVTVTAAQAELLRAHLAPPEPEPEPEYASGGLLPPSQPALNETNEPEPVVPVKRGPGRPRKQQG